MRVCWSKRNPQQQNHHGCTSPQSRCVSRPTQTADVGPLTDFPVATTTCTKNADTQTTRQTTSDKNTQIFKFTLSTDNGTMTDQNEKGKEQAENKKTVGNIATNTIITSDYIDGLMTDIQKVHEKKLEFLEKCEYLEARLQSIIKDSKSYADFAYQEMKNSLNACADLFDKFVPRHQIQYMDQKASDFINYAKNRLRQHEPRYS